MGQTQALAGAQAVPRWRLLPCSGTRPDRFALQTVHRLREPEARLPLWGQPRYSAVAQQPRGRYVFVAAGETPVGCALARLHETTPPDYAWRNLADSALQRRGYDPGMLRLVKLAAVQAIGGKPARLSSIFITPLPHRPGELLLRTSSGWTGRARAWTQHDHLLALAWEG